MRTRKKLKRKSLPGKTRKLKYKTPKIRSNYDSGNIIVDSIECDKKNVLAELRIVDDPYQKNTKFRYQYWFYFNISDVKGKNCKFKINKIRKLENEWSGYKVCYSYDNKIWKRCDATVNNSLIWKIKPKYNKIWFAYYPPYTLSKKNILIKKYKKKEFVKHKIIGYSSQKRPINMLVLGYGLKNIWIIARQHPGESIGSWIVEGFLDAYFSPKHKKDKEILMRVYKIHIIPIANPDGVYMGRWYLQNKGYNMNRDWQTKKSPEVRAISKIIDENPYTVVLDIHGDEEVKKHFVSKSGKNNDVYETFNKWINKYNSNFQLKDHYKTVTNTSHGTCDGRWKNSLTIEGAMKHKKFNKTVQSEGLKIGESIMKTLKHL